MNADENSTPRSEGSHNFAYVAGTETPIQVPAPVLAAPTASVFEALVDAIAVMTRGRRGHPFYCTVLRQENGTRAEYELQVWPATESYRCVNVKTGDVYSYDGETREIVAGTESRIRESNQIMIDPPAVRLAFPVNLPVWGRGSSDYRMIGASRYGDEIIVQLRHQADPHFFGSVTVNTAHRMVTRFDTPGEICWYQDITFGERASNQS